MPEADRKSAPLTARPILAIAGVVLLILALTIYAARRVIAREALTGWLNARGIASETEVRAFGLSGFTGRLRIGDPARPDVTVESAEVRYGWRGLNLEVRSVKLTRPVIRARLHNGQLSMGALDPLIAEFRKRPPQPDAAKPKVEIDGGVLLLATDYGPVRLTADARIADGKLLSLAAASSPAVLQGPQFSASLGAATATLATHGGRVDLTLDAPILKAATGQASLTAGRLQVRAAAPYPDLEKKRGDGALVVHANLTAQGLAAAGQTLEGAQLSTAFTGQAVGWIPDLTVTGDGTADLRAAGLAGPARAGALRLAGFAKDLRWTRKGGDAVTTQAGFTAIADDVRLGDLHLELASGNLAGPVSLSAARSTMALRGGAAGVGGWSGLGPPTKEDSADIVAVKRAARRFGFNAPGLAVGLDSLALTKPVEVRPATGGAIRLAPAGRGYTLAMAGGGLPKVDADIARFDLADGGAVARGRVRAQLSIGPIEHGDFDAAGTLRIADTVRFTADRCVTVKAPKLELGENDVQALAARLCPAGGPMLTLAGDDWSIAGQAQGFAAEIPFLQARLAEAAGRLQMRQAAGRLGAAVTISAAQVHDTAPETRFNPLRLTGKAALAREVWTADLAVATPAGVHVADARLTAGETDGHVDFDTGVLAFAEGGLQPVQLSPLAAAVGSPAQGQARFTGGFQWSPAGETSHGTLDVPRLDFLSPAGRVTGLSGKVVFTSLAPQLIAAPGQVFTAEAVAAPLAPLTGVTATFGLEAAGLRISGGEAAVGGGRVRIESLDVPLDPKAATRGALLFEEVQLHDLVEASLFGDRVDLDAKVSGRVPFEIQDGKVRVQAGALRAVAPGRLSIQREALTDVSSNAAAAAPKGAAAHADPFSDFAYQAMENLAFDTLEAGIDTYPDGRLGVLFHIVGRHDPPQRQEIRLTVMDLIRRDFLNRKLPLPSGTGVNLTLDTTLNMDELLADYANYQRLRGSGSVQP